MAPTGTVSAHVRCNVYQEDSTHEVPVKHGDVCKGSALSTVSDEWDRAGFLEEVALSLEGGGRKREKNILEVMT